MEPTTAAHTGAELVTRFGTVDYVVFVLCLAVSAFIGLYYACTGGKQSSTNELLLGNRSMSVLPVSMSILASFISAITLLGTPAEIYQYGTQYMAILLSFFFVIPAAGYIYLPVFYNLQLTSAYQYLEFRFNVTVRSIASFIFSFQMLIYMAIVLYAPALALSQVTGISVWFSVLSIGIVCTFYTSVGGIKAVIWTDFFQIFLMIGSMLTIVIKGAQDVGGMAHVWQRNYDGNRIEFFNFDPDPLTRHTVWNLVIGGYFTWIAVYGVNQAMVQRYLTLPTLKKARTAIWINLPGLILLVLLTSLAGMIIWARFHDCDPIKTKRVAASDQLFPLFVMETLGEFPGLPGLFVSGIFSGALSTVSSGVNSLAAVTLEDGIKSYVKKDISEVWAARITKILAVLYGVLSIILVIVAQQLGNVLQAALSIFGMIGGPLLGLFTFGMFFPWGNSVGAGVGVLGGLTMSLWLGLGAFVHKPYVQKQHFSVAGCLDLYNNITKSDLLANETILIGTPPPGSDEVFPFYRISYMWYSTFGCLMAIVIGLIVSLLTGGFKQCNGSMDPNLISPLVRCLSDAMPLRMAKSLRMDFLRKTSPQEKPSTNGNKNEGVDSLRLSSGVTNLSYAPSEADLRPEKIQVNGRTETSPL